MKVLFSMLCLFLCTIASAQDIHLVVAREEVVNYEPPEPTPKASSAVFSFPAHDVPPGDRKVTFKITNDSDKSIVIFGLAYDTTFQPAGFMFIYNVNSEKWNGISPEIEAVERKQLSQADKKILERGESLEFFALLSFSADKGKRFKRTVYYSSEADGCRPDIIATEFSLSK